MGSVVAIYVSRRRGRLVLLVPPAAGNDLGKEVIKKITYMGVEESLWDNRGGAESRSGRMSVAKVVESTSDLYR